MKVFVNLCIIMVDRCRREEFYLNQVFENLRLDKFIVHKIYQRGIESNIKEPTFSDGLMMLNSVAHRKFKERIVEALGSDSHSIEMELKPINVFSTFHYASSIVEDLDNFISQSKHITNNLVNAQNKCNIPGGLVIVFSGTIGTNNKRYIGILKAEEHDGFKVEKGEHGIQLSLVDQLILTPQQKLYKIGMYICNDAENPTNPASYSCYIYDSKFIKDGNGNAAKYFYDDFFGCCFPKDSKEMTKEFYKKTKEFIKKQESIPIDQKIDLNNALYTYLVVENNQIISTYDFREKYLPNRYHSLYSTFMDKKGIPNRDFQKDLSLIQNNMRQRKILFSNNIVLNATSEDFIDNIKINYDGDQTIITIKGKSIEEK